MKLYNKQLSSLEALRGEKIRLRTELRHAKSHDFNPLSELGASKISGFAKEGFLGFLVDLLSTKSNFQTAMTVAKPLLRLVGRRRDRRSGVRMAANTGVKRKSTIKKIATELAVGYFTGKAVQMVFRGLAMYIRRRKKHKVSAKHLVM